MEKPYLIKRHRAVEGKIFDFLRDTYDNDLERQVIHMHNNAVAMWVHFTGLGGNEIMYLGEEFRAGIGEIRKEIIAGKIKPNEDLNLAMFRELREELGIRQEEVESWTLIDTIKSSQGFTDETVTIFDVVLKGRPRFVEQKLDKGELINIKEYRVDAWIANHTSKSAPSAIARLYAKEHNYV